MKRRALPAINTLIDLSVGVLMPLSAVFQQYFSYIMATREKPRYEYKKKTR
jgi:hypothetical protein